MRYHRVAGLIFAKEVHGKVTEKTLSGKRRRRLLRVLGIIPFGGEDGAFGVRYAGRVGCTRKEPST